MFLSEWDLAWPILKNPYEVHRCLWRLFPDCPDERRSFLFRVEWPRFGGRGRLLLQSRKVPSESPDSEIILLRGPKPLRLFFRRGMRLLFSVCTNPVKRLNQERCRVPLIDEGQRIDWLRRKLDGVACEVEAHAVISHTLHFLKGRTPGKIVTVTFSGVLTVVDPDGLDSLVREGIGAAKSFGCGLLTLARQG